MSILYRYGSTWYINMTNRCPCRCAFCVRNHVRKLGDADSLWLVAEPTATEVEAEILARASDADEIVFCGYGEPTERLEDLLEIANWIYENTSARVRLDTNGLGSLINGRDVVPELAEVLDAVSVSLNASSSEEYEELCHPEFGERSYPAILEFIEGMRDRLSDVTVSVVGGSIPSESEAACAGIARSMGVRFRVRRRAGTNSRHPTSR